MTPDDLGGYIEQNGLEEVINALLDEGSDTWELVYPGLESGRFGHYQPSEDQPDLPESAITRASDGGEVVQSRNLAELPWLNPVTVDILSIKSAAGTRWRPCSETNSSLRMPGSSKLSGR